MSNESIAMSRASSTTFRPIGYNDADTQPILATAPLPDDMSPVPQPAPDVNAPNHGLRNALLFLFWIGGNIAGVIWAYYTIKITIFPLSSESRAIARSTVGAAFFDMFQNYLIAIVTVWNLTWLWIFIGPIVTRKARPPDTPAPYEEGTIRPDENQTRLATRLGTGRRRIKIFFRQVLILAVVAVSLLVLHGITSYASWWMFPARVGWQRAVWNGDVCQGWDYEISFDTLNFQQLTVDGVRSEFKLSNATWKSTSGGVSTLMDLQHPSPNISVTTIYGDNDTSSFTIQYNFTSLQYLTSGNVTGLFNNEWQVLEFPNISLSSLYRDYPWSHYCRSPSVVLIDANNTEVVRTGIENYDDCTMLKVCGRGDIESLAVPLGAIFIEMEKAGLCCTHPEG